MITKFTLADELAQNMAQELKPFEKIASDQVSNAANCIHAAIEILKDSGFDKNASELSDILCIIANPKPTHVRQHLPNVQDMLDKGITLHDFKKMNAGSVHAKAKINKVLHEMGFNAKEIANVIGVGNVMSKIDADTFANPHSSSSTILKMIENPLAPIPSQDVKPGDEIIMESLAAKHKKPQDPRKISDPHTKGLTSEKMIKNLLHHGTEFNMSDDGTANDLLDLDINDADLEVLEHQISGMDFEDEV